MRVNLAAGVQLVGVHSVHHHLLWPCGEQRYCSYAGSLAG